MDKKASCYDKRIRQRVISLPDFSLSDPLGSGRIIHALFLFIIRSRSSGLWKVIFSLEITNVTLYKYYSWINQLTAKYSNFLLKKCIRIWPNQLTKRELLKMKKLLSLKKFRGWPICSIAYYAIREKILTVSIGTWYKYVKLLGFKRVTPKSRRKKKVKGIRALLPNKIWHADITEFRTQDGLKAYIYLLIDNCSRYILSWRANLKKSGKIRMETLQEAYLKFIKPPPPDPPIGLLVDKGSENENQIVDDFLKNEDVSIEKIIAVETFVNKFNNEIPNDVHKGLTPEEVFNGIKFNKEKYKKQIEKSKKARIIQNRKLICKECR